MISKKSKAANFVSNDLKLLARGLITSEIHSEENWALTDHDTGIFEISAAQNAIEPMLANLEPLMINRTLYEYAKEYLRADLKRNFAFKFVDGALIQIGYVFENEALKTQRLAYMQRPFSNDELDFYSFDAQEIDHEMDSEIVDEDRSAIRKSGLACIRFDFDPARGAELIHPNSHLTIANHRSCRIPVSSPMTCRQFLELVVQQFYPEHLSAMQLFLKKNHSKFMERKYVETFFPKEKNAFRVHTSK